MRDVNRIPAILKELEKVWLENPDYRLGQLITLATRPSTPHPATFYIEYDKMLDGLMSMSAKTNSQNQPTAYWEKYPEICRINVEELNSEIVMGMLTLIKSGKKNMIVTPVKLMELSGAPVDDDNWMTGQQPRIDRLEAILEGLLNNGAVEVAQIGYKIKE